MTISGRVLVFVCVVYASAAAAQNVPERPVRLAALAQGKPKLSSTSDYEAAQLAAIVAAMRTTENITINGLLDEPAWERAAPAGNFIQRRPRTGEPMTERTAVRLGREDEHQP
jgi:hypothetical protein